MVTIKIFSKNSSIEAVEVSGHAGFAKSGRDVVCAGVSAVVQSALLGLLKVAGLNVPYESSDGFLKFALPNDLTQQKRHDADVILNTMQCSLEDLAEGRKKFIKLEVYAK